MGKFVEKILYMSLGLFAIMVSWIIMNGLLAYNKIIFEYNPIILIIGVVTYILIISLLYKFIIAKMEKIKFIEYFIFILLITCLVISGLYFKVNPTWDMGTTFDIAKEYVEKGTYTNTFYLSQFPNNIMMTIIDVILLKGMSVLGVKDFITGITIVTAFVIFMSIFISFFIIKKVYNRKKALTFLLIAFFTTPLYLYAAEYYTDTFSMIIPVLLLYIWIYMEDEHPLWRRIFTDIIFSIILFVGIKLKLTSAFVVIAILFYEIICGKCKRVIKKMIIIIPVIVLLLITFNFVVVDKLAPKDERNLNEVPKEHWIMMGMNGVGNFSYSEYGYTNAPENKTFEQKKRADIIKIKERIVTRTANEHIKNLSGKLFFAWHDGTYWAPDVLRREPCNKKILHEYILEGGKYSDYYKYIPQVMHFSLLFFIFVNICTIIKRKDKESKDIIMLVTIFGVMLFLLIWENRSRYLVNILPLMLMSQLNGIEYITNKFFYKKKGW